LRVDRFDLFAEHVYNRRRGASMEESSDGSDRQSIPGLAVALLTEDPERLAVLQSRVESTHMARLVFCQVGFPIAATDPVIRQIQELGADVVLVDFDPEDLRRAIHTIELLQGTTNIAIFAIGDMRYPTHIVAAMQAGASEFLERAADEDALLEAFSRFSVARSRTRSSNGKARIFMVINVKGGAGATTLAVNLATALQKNHGQTVLVDFAPIGHAALHLNVRPSFGVLDALQNLHRMDETLLEALVTTATDGLHLLAGSPQPPSYHRHRCGTDPFVRSLGHTLPLRGGGLFKPDGRHYPPTRGTVSYGAYGGAD
jgi:AAA domain-containing protein